MSEPSPVPPPCLPPGVDFAHEYKVSAWVPGFAQSLANLGLRARAARAQVTGLLDLPYGTARAERLDFFHGTETRNKPPLLIFLHGGFWRRLDKDDFSWIAPPYMAQGISVAIVNYGLAPATPLEDIVGQCLRSIAWLYREADTLGFDRQRIFVAGHSAGGHLAAMALSADWKSMDNDLPSRLLAGGIVLSPLADLTPLAQVPELHADLDFTPERIARLSPVRLQPRTETTVIGAVGGRESGEFKRQLALLEKAWTTVWETSVDMPDEDHLSLCDAFADPSSPLFEAALSFCMRKRADKKTSTPLLEEVQGGAGQHAKA